MKTWLNILLICLSLFFSAAAVPAISPDHTAEHSYMFVQLAKQGTLSKVVKQPGIYQLTLAHMDDKVEYFTDRPVRIAGNLPSRVFISNWNKIFKSSAPNVGVTGFIKNSAVPKAFSTVLILSQPVFNQHKRTLTYIAHTLSGEARLPDKIEFDGLALFIDDFCASCVGNQF